MNQKAHVAYNFDCHFEHETFLNVTYSHSHSKCGSISEAVQSGVVVTTDH